MIVGPNYILGKELNYMYIKDEHSQNYVSKLYEYMVFVMIIQR